MMMEKIGIRYSSSWTSFRTFTLSIITLITVSIHSKQITAVRVLDLDGNLPDLIEKHQDNNWLVEFYAPWCHHCQQLEPTYNNVAESVYQKHENLIVGRVDCTKAGRVCEQFGVNSYPTIMFLNKDSQIVYRGDRSHDSILAFANRVLGPTVNTVDSCETLKEATNKHGLVILSTYTDSDNQIRKEFESLANAYKASHWFYQFYGRCKELFADEGLYLLKRHLDRSIKFEPQDSSSDGTIDLKADVVQWLNKESFMIYGKISSRNIERVLATGKLLVIAILDEYKPARQYAPTSKEFSKKFEMLARDLAQSDDSLLLGWSSDIELIEYITITPIQAKPNVIILNPDLSYYLMLSNDSLDSAKDSDKSDDGVSEKLSPSYIRSVIDQAKAGKLVYSGGSSYFFSIVRYAIGNLNKFLNMYRANPLLVLVIFGFPSLIIIFVIYTTCIQRGEPEEDDEDEGYSDNDYDGDVVTRRLPDDDHLKQD